MALNKIDKKMIDDSFVQDVENVKNTASDLTVKLAETDDRIDTIITTPATGISQQEIVDARQSEASLGANLTKVKNTILHTSEETLSLKEKTEDVFKSNSFYDSLNATSKVISLPSNTSSNSKIEFEVQGKSEKSTTVSHLQLNGLSTKTLAGDTINAHSFPNPLVLKGVNGNNDVLKSTGEITRKIGSVVLNGSQNAVFSSTQFTGVTRVIVSNLYLKAKYISPAIVSVDTISNFGNQRGALADVKNAGDYCVYSSGNESVLIALDNTKTGLTSASSISQINAYLQANPIKIEYALKSENYVYESSSLNVLRVESHAKLVADSTLTPQIKIDYMKRAIEAGVKYSENLFDGNYTLGKIISANTSVNQIYSEAGKELDYVSAILPIKPLNYSILCEGVFDKFNIGFANSTDQYAPVVRLKTSVENAGREEFKVTNTDGYKFLIITVSTMGKKPNLYVMEGTEAANSPIVKIGEKAIALKSDLQPFNRYSMYFQSEELSPYLPPTYTEVYQWYDELMAKSNGYITRTVLGVDGQGNELREYRFTKGIIPNSYGFTKPLIGIMAGLHGEEKAQVVGLYHFLKNLTLNEAKNETIDKIKSNIDFRIIPVGNPTGFNLNIRNNWNGVNLNRNFNFKWAENNEADKGSSPASEKETQLLQTWMQAHPFEQFIDFHRSDMTADNDQASWFVANYEGEHSLPMRKEYFRVMALLSNLWSNRYPQLPKNISFGTIHTYGVYPQSWQYAASLGMKASLVEVSETWRYFALGYDKLRLRNSWAADVMGNYIFEISKRYC